MLEGVGNIQTSITGYLSADIYTSLTWAFPTGRTAQQDPQHPCTSAPAIRDLSHVPCKEHLVNEDACCHLVNEEPGVLWSGPTVYGQPLVGTEGLLGVRGLGGAGLQVSCKFPGVQVSGPVAVLVHGCAGVTVCGCA